MENSTVFADIKDKHSYFQGVIMDTPDFLENPDNYAKEVYHLLFLFFNGSEVFDDFAIVPGEGNYYGLVAIVDLTDNEKALYQVNKKELLNSTEYKTTFLTVKGQEYLGQIMSKIFNMHIYHTVESAYYDLDEKQQTEIEKQLKLSSSIPHNLWKQKIKVTMISIRMFFKKRDAKVYFKEYTAIIEHRDNTFHCKILKYDEIESDIVLNTTLSEINIKNESSFKETGLFQLQETIATKIFEV